MTALPFQCLFVVASRLTLKAYGVGNDVDRHSPGDQADVRRRFLINPAEPHFGDPLRGDLDRADSSFGANPGMGLKSVDVKLHPICRRRPGEEKADRVAVQHQSSARPETGDI